MYKNLAAMGWKLGVHRAPDTGYEHTWLVVFADRTDGAHTRADARQWWSCRHKDGRCPEALPGSGGDLVNDLADVGSALDKMLDQ